jgi:hypothetical protein
VKCFDADGAHLTFFKLLSLYILWKMTGEVSIGVSSGPIGRLNSERVIYNTGQLNTHAVVIVRFCCFPPRPNLTGMSGVRKLQTCGTTTLYSVLRPFAPAGA